jgi:hypothetical protein
MRVEGPLDTRIQSRTGMSVGPDLLLLRSRNADHIARQRLAMASMPRR